VPVSLLPGRLLVRVYAVVFSEHGRGWRRGVAAFAGAAGLADRRARVVLRRLVAGGWAEVEHQDGGELRWRLVPERRYVAMPAAVCGLTAAAQAVYGALRYSGRHLTGGGGRQKQQQVKLAYRWRALCAATGYGRSAVFQAVAELEAAGWLVRRRVPTWSRERQRLEWRTAAVVVRLCTPALSWTRPRHFPGRTGFGAPERPNKTAATTLSAGAEALRGRIEALASLAAGGAKRSGRGAATGGEGGRMPT